ncbi:MAG: energy transducer TonB [Tidjanibacter sp.]|nr:energy transducer TonB [Tidjanibacter sp.]
MAEKPQHNGQPKRPKLNLPFTRKRVDLGVWAYDHRVAILILVFAYVLFGVAFVAADVVVSKKHTQSDIMIDLTDLEALQEELKRVQELNKLLNERYENSPTANRISNENALDDRLEDHRTDASKIYSEADEVQQRIRDNASAYALGLEGERKILDQRYEGEKIENRKVRGNVTVSFSLANPVRYAVQMPVPAYMCEGGGEVVVDITVNNSGEVIDCKVNDALSAKNNCLREAALAKAGTSLFNADPTAPARQKGTIEYQFIAQ